MKQSDTIEIISLLKEIRDLLKKQDETKNNQLLKGMN
jgi:hypothetical protein